jgi:hypothetical protein
VPDIIEGDLHHDAQAQLNLQHFAVGFAGTFTVNAEEYPEVADWVEHTKISQSSLVVLKVEKYSHTKEVRVVLVGAKPGRHTIQLRGPSVSPAQHTSGSTVTVDVAGTFTGKFVCQGRGLTVAEPGGGGAELTQFTIDVYDSDGSLRSLGLDQFLEVDLSSIDGQVTFSAETTDFRNGSYGISFSVPPGVSSAAISIRYMGTAVTGPSCSNQMARVLSIDEGGRLQKADEECPLELASRRITGAWHNSSTWKPIGCHWRSFSAAAAQQCLAGHKITFCGDSHMREQFVSLVELLQGGGGFEFKPDVTFKVGQNTTLRFWWTNSVFLAPFHEKPQEVSPDVFYMSAYLADYGSYFRGVEEYANAAAASTVQLHQQYPAARLLWHLPHVLHPGKSNPDWRVMNGWEQQHQMRGALKEALHNASSALAQPLLAGAFDPWDLTRPVGWASKDGNHYWQSGKPRGGAVLTAKVEVLLNLLCRGVLLRNQD